jgi:hypothetical protein
MPSTNMIARINSVTKNPAATTLLQRVAFYCRLKTGGVVMENRLWSYRSIDGWAEEIALSFDQTRRAMTLLKNLHLVDTRMCWLGQRGSRMRVLHVALTSRSEAIIAGDEDALRCKSASDVGCKSASTPDANLHLSIEEPVDLPVDLPETLANASLASGAAADQKDAGQMQKITSVGNLAGLQKLKMYHHQPDTLGSLEAIWLSKVAATTGAYTSPLTIKQRGQLSKFRKACPPGTGEKVLTYVLNDWIDFAKTVQGMAGLKLIPTHPSIGFLLTYASQAVTKALPKALPKHEAKSAVFSEPAPLLTPNSEPQEKKLTTLAEIWGVLDDED